MIFFYSPKLILTTILLLALTPLLYSQNNLYTIDSELLKISSSLDSYNHLERKGSNEGFENSLAFKQDFNKKWGSVNLPQELINDDFKPWESEKHFWVGVTEIAILEFIPW